MDASVSSPAIPAAVSPEPPRRSVVVRLTHWLTAISFLALLLSGVEILLSHPRFYWGETGTVMDQPLFKLPLPSSRDTVPTGFGYVLPDQNGWSRYLHFEAAWLAVLCGFVYVSYGFSSGHFRRYLLSAHHGRAQYSLVQRLTYLSVIFVLFPLIVWSGLAMSPAIGGAVPAVVSTLGGQQSARTIHFADTVLLTTFFVVHVAMVIRAGFVIKMRGMLTGVLQDAREAQG